MAYGMNEWRLDWFVMNTRQPGYEAWLQSEDGFWDSSGVNNTKTARVNAHGAVVSPVWKSERSITLDGRAYARSDRQVKQLAQAIKGLCADPRDMYRLSTKTELGELEAQVRLDGPILVDSGDDFASSITFSIQLVAPDPRIYESAWRDMATGLARQTEGGLDFEYTSGGGAASEGLNFTGDGLGFGEVGSGQTGYFRMRNTGTAPAPVILTLYGPLTDPVITNMNTGSSIRYNDTLEAGEFVVIDPAAPSVLLGGTASRRHLANPADFSSFFVPPATPFGPAGELSIGLTHDGPATDPGRLTARWRSASW